MKDSFGRTKTFDLIVEGNLNELRKIDDVSMLNLRDNDGKTPLHFACIHENFEIVNFLINQEVDIDPKDKHGNTPLFDAIFNSGGDGKIVKLLLENGANPEEKNNYDVSPKTLVETISNFDLSKLF